MESIASLKSNWIYLVQSDAIDDITKIATILIFKVFRANGMKTKFSKLKTTPTPNKNGSYGVKSGFVCHKSRSSYAIKVGLWTRFSVKVPLFRGIFTPCDPSFYGIFWEHIFCEYGGVVVVKIVFIPLSRRTTTTGSVTASKAKCPRQRVHLHWMSCHV